MLSGFLGAAATFAIVIFAERTFGVSTVHELPVFGVVVFSTIMGLLTGLFRCILN